MAYRESSLQRDWDLEVKEENQIDVNHRVDANPNLIRNIKYNPPNSFFVSGYSNPPTCK